MSPIPKVTAGSRLIRAGSLSPDTFAPFGEVIQNPATHNGHPALDHVVGNQGTATVWLDVTKMTNYYSLSRSQRAANVLMRMFVCKPRDLEDRQGAKVFPVEILERHPFTPQTFIPLGLSSQDRGACYLVIVAPTLPVQQSGREKDSLSPPYPLLEPRRRRSFRERLLGARPNPFTNDFTPTTTPKPSQIIQVSKSRGPGLPDLENLQAFIAMGDQAVTYGPGTWHAPMVVLGMKEIEFVVVQYANGVASEDCQEVSVAASDGGKGLAIDVGTVMESTEGLRAKL